MYLEIWLCRSDSTRHKMWRFFLSKSCFTSTILILAHFSLSINPLLQFHSPMLYPFLPFPFIILFSLFVDLLQCALDNVRVTGDVEHTAGAGLLGGLGAHLDIWTSGHQVSAFMSC